MGSDQFFFGNSRQSGLGRALMVLIMAGGILLTARLGLLQIRRLPLALKWMFKNEEEATVRFPALQLYVQH